MIEKITSGAVTAEIDSLGGQIVSFKKNDKEYIWQRNPKFWDSCAPVLFPVVGRLKNQVLTIKGKDYPMPMHGFVKDMDMTVADKAGSSVTFKLTDNEQTKELYPWSFCFFVSYTLNSNKLTIEFKVKNRDSETMLFTLGGHPGFNIPLSDDEKFTDYQLEFEKEEILKSNYVNPDISISTSKKITILKEGRVIPLKRSLFDNDTLIFEDIESKWVKLANKYNNKGIKLSYADFPTLAVWTKRAPNEAPFVCLEPWLGMGFRDNETAEIEGKYGIQKLEPEEIFTAAFSMEIID